MPYPAEMTENVELGRGWLFFIVLLFVNNDKASNRNVFLLETIVFPIHIFPDL
jgi:hypothetical protein